VIAAAGGYLAFFAVAKAYERSRAASRVSVGAIGR
jgi:hypothetical protein